jgi:hypothetical protein
MLPPCGKIRCRDPPSVGADAIGLRRIDLKDVAVPAKTAEIEKVFDILQAEQVFTGAERRRVVARQFCKGGVIQRRARFLEPSQPVGRQRGGVVPHALLRQSRIGIDGEMVGAGHQRDGRLDAGHIVLD